MPSGHGFRSTLPPPPWGHPDFVLARAVAEGAITADEAELIGSTRLEGVPLATAAEDRGVTYEAVKKTRLRAEHRLVAYLRDTASTESHTGPAHGDPATQAADAMIIASAARTAVAGRESPLTVTDLGARAAEKVQHRVSPKGPETGVRGCGRTPATPAHTTSPDSLAASSGMTPEVPRCA